MSTTILILLSLFLPILAGAIILFLPSSIATKKENAIAYFSIAIMALTVLTTALMLFQYKAGIHVNLRLTRLAGSLPIYLSVDGLSAFFLSFAAIIWLLAGIFSLEYIRHEGHRRRFWGFYLLTLGSFQGLSLSGNLVTLYLFFEMMTLVSMPMVLHSQTHNSIMAGLKYLFYSMAGAYMALFGLFVFANYCGTTLFIPGGILSQTALETHPLSVHLAILFMIVGFGVKAGLFPMHAWLPTAHPVAPAPASAILSAIIVKGGILAIIRSVFYIAGVSAIRGTWVQYTWMGLAMFTVFMGSMLAYNEKVFKKRLAYSSVSQASYILLGLSFLQADAITGSLLHILFHAIIKTALFLTAGAIIYKTGCTKVTELRGIGKEMPVTIWAYTFAALGLIGIPPLSGFVSKWYLASGMLATKLPVVSWLGPVILLVSALLTAGYLLPITTVGFLPGDDYNYEKRRDLEPSWKMYLPLLILAAATLIIGVFPTGIISFLKGITHSIL